jgi:hypothetical protein
MAPVSKWIEKEDEEEGPEQLIMESNAFVRTVPFTGSSEGATGCRQEWLWKWSELSNGGEAGEAIQPSLHSCLFPHSYATSIRIQSWVPTMKMDTDTSIIVCSQKMQLQDEVVRCDKWRFPTMQLYSA